MIEQECDGLDCAVASTTEDKTIETPEQLLDFTAALAYRKKRLQDIKEKLC